MVTFINFYVSQQWKHFGSNTLKKRLQLGQKGCTRNMEQHKMSHTGLTGKRYFDPGLWMKMD